MSALSWISILSYDPPDRDEIGRKDHPTDFYDRLRINLDLNEELGLQIFSFLMRYVDLKSKNRLTSTPGNIGENWNVKFLRAIQCVLIRTRGLVGTKRDYFLKAFGSSHEEFYKIMLMPESYIIHRFDHEGDCQSALKIDPPQASKIDPPQVVVFSY